MSLNDIDNSLENSMEKAAKEEQGLIPKNPYLNNNDVPELVSISKNKIIFFNKKEYDIKEYLDKINNTTNDLFDDYKYNYCGNCKKNKNKYFCFNCDKNICEKCIKDCDDDDHSYQNLEENNNKNNIAQIKSILDKCIIPLNKDEKVIKDINQYIDKYIINNHIYNIIYLFKDNFTLTNDNEKNEDISLIYQIIAKNYHNYFHYKNIEKILNYVKKEYYNYIINEYNGFGKKLNEAGEYYKGEFKNGLKHGKGILFYKKGRLMHFGKFEGNKFVGSGTIEYQIYDYYIGQWKNDFRHGKGKLCYKNGRQYLGDWVNDIVVGKGKAYYEYGEYYEGGWKNGSRHGKGIKYYENGKIKFEGNFLNHKYNGYGKYIYENGEYYIGEWKNGLREGKGTLYNKNNKIKYKGEFINDNPI